MRRFLALAAAVLTAAALAAPAAAHVQVRPTVAAPGDPVLFEVIVPGERDAQTIEVTLQIPKDVLPFSFQDPPGWTRTNQEASDGSLESIRWRGELAEDGFARFAFLASTPEQEGDIAWKALQTYDDGHISRWIGAPDSENPAAVTKVTASAPRQNAGGEGGEAATEGSGETPAPVATASPASAPVEEESDSPLPLILSIVAVVLGAAALLVALRPRRPAAT